METSYKEELKIQARKIKYFFSDVDGTLTDGSIYYGPDGEMSKRFSMKDGSGFFLLRCIGVKSGIITGEKSPIVTSRAKKLRVDILLDNAVPKVRTFEKLMSEYGISFEEVAYIGDGFNDMNLLKKVGLGFAVNDAEPIVKKAAKIVCERNGGDGAFLDAVLKLLSLRGEDIDCIIKKYL